MKFPRSRFPYPFTAWRRTFVLIPAVVLAALAAAQSGSAAPSKTPVVATGSATNVGYTSAEIGGTVNSNGQATTYHFDYGTSTNYTLQAPVPPDPSAGSGTTAQNESTTLTGLSPDTVYYYRIEATDRWGTRYGADQTFTTGSPPASADIQVTDSALYPVIYPGTFETLTVTVTNVGPDAAQNVVIKYGGPLGSVTAPAGVSVSCAYSSPITTCTTPALPPVASLAPGAANAVTITFRRQAVFVSKLCVNSDEAWATSVTFDPNLNNNTAYATWRARPGTVYGC